MKKIMLLLVAFVLTIGQALAAGGGFGGELLLANKCYEFGKTGAGSFSDPAAGVDGDIIKIPVNAVVDRVDVLIHTALTGTTVVTVGDDDDADGYVAAADATEGTPGVYNGAGAYIGSAAKKYYSASGKEVKLDITGTLTAGKYCVSVHGYRM